MTKTLLAGVAVLSVLSASAAHASFTQCAVREDTETLNRPGGNHDPRWASPKKGDRVALRDAFKDWVFITWFPYEGGGYEYGWLSRSVLINCHVHEGTP
jgi:hypothetical protein